MNGYQKKVSVVDLNSIQYRSFSIVPLTSFALSSWYGVLSNLLI